MLLRGGNPGGALSALELAVEKGYSVQMLAADPQLASLRDKSRFNEITYPTKSR